MIDTPTPPSHWNYRIIRRVHDLESITNPGEKWTTFGIHEVYYTNGKPSMCSVEPQAPHGETLEELLEDFEHFKLALSKPMLDFDKDFNEDE